MEVMKDSGTAAFTLIELLIVIAVLGILAAGIILVLNPVELLNRAQDGKRVTDLSSIHSALLLYEVGEGTVFGNANTVYISLPDDTSSTCATHTSLPSLPSPWNYACVMDADLIKIDGTGWVPVPFSSISSGPPFARLPIDPENSASEGLYYAYVTGGSWALTGLLESERELASAAAGDGGTDDGRFEVGTDLALWTSASGLVGYWPLNGSAGDVSGNSLGGSLVNGPIWQTGTSCKVGGCLELDGINQYVDVPDSALMDNMTELTWSAWIYTRDVNKDQIFLTRATQDYMRILGTDPFLSLRLGVQTTVRDLNTVLASNNWYFFTSTWDGSEMKLYVDGELKEQKSVAATLDFTSSWFHIGIYTTGDPRTLDGFMDEVRVYNRALSEPEINALYTAGK